ncbi:hypothetical protein [Alteribacillus bidgolensis]|uniref:Uncharacterized protein n=1 Tax=Alteribacillus bidgolensis TaxID=930129 RepID=A0A1G8L150_9BACI|nr:hypothetical protein [Alteribacillus bidgolensis]SDI49398.1 hypothetical protein SAMN05216352_108106 [Alteribacillus bidgolensis]
MKNQINGYDDMYTVLANERKVGGVIESEYLRLSSGDEFYNVVITKVELIGSALCSIGCVTENGQKLIVNAKDISMIHQPEHKKIFEIRNQTFKHTKMKEKLKYLKRLFELNEGSYNPFFKEEAAMIIEDIGLSNAKQEIDVSVIYPEEKVYTIA